MLNSDKHGKSLNNMEYLGLKNKDGLKGLYKDVEKYVEKCSESMRKVCRKVCVKVCAQVGRWKKLQGLRKFTPQQLTPHKLENSR